MAPPDRPPPRNLTVLGTHRVTPHMLRVTLGGPGLDGFPAAQEGGYVKLRLPVAGGKTAVRTYTIRAQRDDAIDIDFALHAETASGRAGPATEWALKASVGDAIAVGGPGPAKPLPPGMDFYLIAGDMTALPAIAVNLAALPADAVGFVALEAMSAEDKQHLDKPEGVAVRWLTVPQPGAAPQALQAALSEISWPGGEVYGWCASEFAAMQGLRDYLRGDRGLGPDRLYISSFWKSGLTEDDHKRIKRADAEAQETQGAS